MFDVSGERPGRGCRVRSADTMKRGTAQRSEPDRCDPGVRATRSPHAPAALTTSRLRDHRRGCARASPFRRERRCRRRAEVRISPPRRRSPSHERLVQPDHVDVGRIRFDHGPMDPLDPQRWESAHRLVRSDLDIVGIAHRRSPVQRRPRRSHPAPARRPSATSAVVAADASTRSSGGERKNARLAAVSGRTGPAP